MSEDGMDGMVHCVECGEDVPGIECYEDGGVTMHAIGVTGVAEPHEVEP